MASSKLSEKDVVNALHGLSDDETSRLFYHLNLPVHTLANIKSNNSGEMLIILCVHEWYKDDLEASWGKIVAGLRHIGMKVLAKKLAIQHYVETPTSVIDNLTSDPINPPVSAQDSDVTQSPVTSESSPVPPPSSVVSTTHPAAITPNPAPSDPVQLSAPTTHTVAVTNDPFQQEIEQLEDNVDDQVQQVKEEMEQFQETFTSMMSMTRSALCKKESEDSEFIEEFRDYLLFLPLSKKAPHTKFFDDREDDILEAKSVRKLLAILGRYCNYSNYDLLLHLIKKFCNTEEKKRMQDYCESLKRFEMATPVNVYLIAISASPAISEAFSRMAMKMNKPVSECTLHEIRKLKESLTEKAFLHSYSVYIDTIAESSVLVVLRFPSDCIGWVLAAVTPDFMDTHHLTEVSVDGEYLTLYPKLQEGNKELVRVFVLCFEREIREKRGYRFEAAFVSITQHTGPHASECAYPSTTGHPSPTQPAACSLRYCTCAIDIHMGAGHRMPRP